MTHIQMISDKSSEISISFEYYIYGAQQCCRVAFKISLCVSNMRLHRVQQRVINGDISINGNYVPSMKGVVGRHATSWMKNYFELNGYKFDNYTRREAYNAYKSEMLTSSKKYVRHLYPIYKIVDNMIF